MRAWPLLLLLAGCARRDRPYVRAAPPPDPGATRVMMDPDGGHRSTWNGTRFLLDAPGRARFREIYPLLEGLAGGHGFELEILVDTEGGEGAVPFRLPETRGGVAYVSRGQLHTLWNFEKTPGSPGVRVRVGQDGVFEIVSTVGAFPRGVVLESTASLAGPAPTLDAARFILLEVASADRLEDIVQAFMALERLHPGKTILDVSSP